MIRLLVMADDFTGALDTGVQFAAAGAGIKVVTDVNAQLGEIPGCEVLVVDTETRHLPQERAYEIVWELTRRAKQAGISYIYKKTDSALRGNVGAELMAVLQASGETYLPFLPTYPQIGRCTKKGVHYIEGVPVAESVFGQDPFEPVRHSAVTDILAEQCGVPVASWPAVTENSALPDAGGIHVFDGETLEELKLAGQRLFDAGRLRIMAGCAGLASVLPGILGLDTGAAPEMPRLDPRLLVVCGSVNPITVAQLDEAERHGFERRRLLPEQKLDRGYWTSRQGEAELQTIRGWIDGHPLRIIDTNDAGGNRATSDYAAMNGLTIEDVRQRVSQTIGILISRIFDCKNLGTLLVTGGDTLLQCMNYMDIHRLRPICELDHGVVLSRFHYQDRVQYVITKSGGFGAPDLMLRIAEQIRSE